MSDESVDKSQHGRKNTPSATPLRVPRREALKGLGALAVSTTAFAATGCGAETMADSGEAATGAMAEGSMATGAPSTSTSSAMTSDTMAASAASSSSQTIGASPPAVATAPTGSAGAAAPMSGAANPMGAAAPSGMPSGGAAMSSSAAGAPATNMAAGAAGSGASPMMMAAPTDLSSLACILAPEMTEGPFFVEEKLNRSDLVMGESDDAIVKAVPLKLVMGIYKVDAMTCSPLPGLQVDIWHANALGIYSDVRSGFVQATDTQGEQFLRGFQITNEVGTVEFATIYPGWYPSRTIHIHFKIRMPMGGNTAYDFTSQMFFDESVSKEVLALAPYSSTPGTRSIFNDDDHIYNGTAMNGQQPPAGQTPPGAETTVELSKVGEGYLALLKVGLKV